MQRAGVREKKKARPNILFKSHFEGAGVLSAVGLVMDKPLIYHRGSSLGQGKCWRGAKSPQSPHPILQLLKP